LFEKEPDDYIMTSFNSNYLFEIFMAITNFW